MVKGVRSGRPSALQRSLHIFRRRWQLHAFMLIPLIYIIIFAYVPMFGLQIAFKNYTIRAGVFAARGRDSATLRRFSIRSIFGVPCATPL